MASTSAVLISTVVILLLTATTAVREGELTVMFGVLRARGYHLFANAISTSDLHYDLRSDGNFTLLALINSALFALDMTMPATNYVTTLRYHVIPRRMSMIDLLSLTPSANSVLTLVPGRDIHVEQRRSVRSLITIGGVDIVVPGMHYGRNMAVHGLGGILEYRNHHSRNSPPPPVNSTGTGRYPPPPAYNITGNYSFQFPVAIESPLVSHLPQNQTVNALPAADGEGIDKSPNSGPIHSESYKAKADERVRRGRLLELASDDDVRQLSQEDDETLDCLLGESAGDQVMDTGVPPRRINIPSSNVICGQ
ncbi:uncharacterized protein LOC143636574 [Bidens hawaiensis]|uniref:uncharacterized protein LOC143636574 n=1 Tax=Bidens hawaiensis TaxID=980011 RepID=UPI00404A2B59